MTTTKGASIAYSKVLDTRGEGILLEGATDGNVGHNVVTRSSTTGVDAGIRRRHGNVIHHNDLRGNSGYDCYDDVSGGIDNTWTANQADDRFPGSIC